MPVYSVFISNETAQLLDRLASSHGGRSAYFRWLIAQAANANVEASPPSSRAPRRGDRTVKVLIRLTEQAAVWVEAEAEAMGMRRSYWIAAFVDRQAAGRPRFSREGELVLFQIHSELRKVRAELGIALSAAADGSPLDVTGVSALSAKLAEQMKCLRAALEGNLSYWHGRP